MLSPTLFLFFTSSNFEYVSAEDVPIFLNEDWVNSDAKRDLSKQKEELGITSESNKPPGLNVFRFKKGGYFSEEIGDYLGTHQIEPDWMLIMSGVVSIRSGFFRYFFMPSYTDLRIISLRELKTLHHLRFPFRISDAYVHGNYLYFKKDNENVYGRIQVESL